MKLLLCNVSWMKRYAGVAPDDVPRHGGEYVREHGYGHEAINFKLHGGKVYGFVQLRTGTISVSRLDPNATDKTDGVLVVWRARSSRGSVIVGWYRNATVYHELQEAVPGRSFRHGGETISPQWVISAKASDGFLVPPQHRSFTVPVSHKGFGSQTFVSFLDSNRQEVVRFKENLLRYISDAEDGNYSPPRRGTWPRIDQVQKLKIERAAIEAAVRFYGSQGYNVVSVEKENAGYDLEARHKGDTLLIEVKGTNHRPADAIVNLSPNEYRKSRARKRQYRICIVTRALTVPEINNFLWDEEEAVWRDENTGKCLAVEEVVSASLTIH